MDELITPVEWHQLHGTTCIERRNGEIRCCGDCWDSWRPGVQGAVANCSGLEPARDLVIGSAGLPLRRVECLVRVRPGTTADGRPVRIVVDDEEDAR